MIKKKISAVPNNTQTNVAIIQVSIEIIFHNNELVPNNLVPI